MNFYKRNTTLNTTTTALFVCMGIMFPLIFHFVGDGLGKILLPMHIPVFLCGLICGPISGVICGILVPIACSLITSVPVMFPPAIAMSLELATYGFLSGLLLELFKKIKSNSIGRLKVVISLLISMLVGRIVHGIFFALFTLMGSGEYSLKIFFIADFITPWIGIVIQIVAIPAIMEALSRLNVLAKYDIKYENAQKE
ncbi:MAG: ECF transporter S component [Clostridia bacterium]|nr:ECF transporter S component [Clostridia bacterium]